MASLILSTCVPGFALPGDIYFSIVNQHNEHIPKWYNVVTNENTMDLDTHDYWNHQPLANPAINLNSTQSAKTKTADEDSSDVNEGIDIADVIGNKSPTITLNLPQRNEKETSDKKSPDGNAGMEVDDVKRVEHSKEVTTETSVDNETRAKPKITRQELQPLKTRQDTKTKKVCKESYLRVQLKSNHKMKVGKYPDHWS